MRRVALMLLAAAIWLGSTVPAQAQTRGSMGSSCAGSSAMGSSAMAMGGRAGFPAFNGNAGMMTGGSSFGIGPSSLMAGGFGPNLNFAASSGMFGGFNTNAFAQGSNGFGGFNNGFGMGTMDGLTAGPSAWTDGFSNGFRMGALAAQNGGLASRNENSVAGNDPTESNPVAMRAAQARNTTKAKTPRMRAAAKRSRSRAKTTRSVSPSR